jgi:signal transduction histidine kinase
MEDAPPGIDFEVFEASGHQVFTTLPAAGPRTNGARREITVPLRGGAWLVASVSAEPRHHAVLVLATAFALAAVPIFFATASLGRMVVRRALRPLSRIAAEADEATHRGVRPQLEHASDPAEVATLAAAFDRLVGRLEATLNAERHFTQDAAHELRTPLTVLSGELEYALQSPLLTGSPRESVVRSLRAARTLSDLVEALLLLRRADAGPLRSSDLAPVNLADVVREVVLEHAREDPRRAEDISVTAEEEAFVPGHLTLLTAAIRNLLSNALKFTSPGQPVRVRVASSGDRCTVIVEDGGSGIPPADRARVFDPFFRSGEARERSEGVGLGLPILRRVARAHGGDVQLGESTLGGARFQLSIPTSAAPHEPSFGSR